MPDKSIIALVVSLSIALVMIVLSSALSVPTYVKGIMLLAAALACIFSASTRYYLYIYGPFLRAKNKTMVIEDDEPFTVAPAGNALLSRHNGMVYSTMFVKIPIYQSATEMTDDEKYDFAKMFSRIVSLNKNPFMVTSQLYVVNKDDFINRIKDKIGTSEQTYQERMNDKSVAPELLERSKGEVTMWHNLLDHVSSNQSFSLLNYVSVTAAGNTEEEAISLSSQRAEELASGISSIVGTNATVITGEELLITAIPEHAIPYSTISEEIRQKTMSEAM